MCAELADSDYLTTTYRGHGWALAKGVGFVDFFAELFGRETGVCRGRGGSMHLCDMRGGPDRSVGYRRRRIEAPVAGRVAELCAEPDSDVRVGLPVLDVP